MHIANNKYLRVVFRPLIWAAEWLGYHNPTMLMKIRYFMRFHKKLNLKNPQTVNEKILYLSLKTDTTLWTRLADKYAVRGYVEERGLADTLAKLYAYWKQESEVNIDSLPDKFVLKSVQGCGDVIIVHNKKLLDRQKLAKKIHKMFHERYGALEGGKHYMRIEPAVIAEELLPVEDNVHSDSLTDYKIWCFNGEPYIMFVFGNRKGLYAEAMIYDLDWHPHPEYYNSNPNYHIVDNFKRPDNLDEMLDVARKLSAGLPEVRCDLYNINGKIYFGEMTMTAYGGMMNSYTEELLLNMGKKIHLEEIKER